MISPVELSQYIDTLRASGVVGRVKIGDIEVTIAAPVAESSDSKPVVRSAKAEYDRMLFAATEGITEEGDQ